MMYSLRALIRQHIRNDKDITRSVNRLLQYLAVLFPRKEYYKLPKAKLIKRLREIEEDLKHSPHSLSTLALMELRKLKVSLEEQGRLEEEIRAIARNHPDYPILKTFPYFGDILIATLIAYYWDIKNFKNLDAFIGYVLMGANFQQSGRTLREIKTDRARTEVKGKFFNLFRASHIKDRRGYTHPYYPLIENIKTLASGGHNLKKRYIKFLSRIFTLVFYALKYRLTYGEALLYRIQEIEKNITRLKEGEANKIKAFELYRAVENLSTYKRMYELVASECQDISVPKKEGAERPDYFRNKEKEGGLNDGSSEGGKNSILGATSKSGKENRARRRRCEGSNKNLFGNDKGGSRERKRGKNTEIRKVLQTEEEGDSETLESQQNDRKNRL